LDIAVAVSDWDKYNEIEVEILKLSEFKKDKKQRQRFIYKKVLSIDIVPFGNIKRRDDKIYWPPDESVAMSVLAFEEVEKNTLILVLANDLNIKVATLAGTFILKMVAWQDRHTKTNKDANDMAFIIQNHLSINQERAAKTYYSQIYLDEDFNINIGGTMLLAFDIIKIMKNNKNALTKFRNIIEGELMAEESSVLINQIIETNSVFEYDETYLCFKKMLLVLENKPTQ
jgi:predicted nucleotidyltransferase